MPTSEPAWQELALGRASHPHQYASQALPTAPLSHPFAGASTWMAHKEGKLHTTPGRRGKPVPHAEPGEQPRGPGQGQH